MTYSTSNPPRCISQGVGNSVKQWQYVSTDPASSVQVSGYFTDGYDLGMRKPDVVEVIDSDATPPAVTRHVVAAASKTGGVDLTAGVATSGSNSD